jgi:hypothetical protein
MAASITPRSAGIDRAHQSADFGRLGAVAEAYGRAGECRYPVRLIAQFSGAMANPAIHFDRDRAVARQDSRRLHHHGDAAQAGRAAEAGDPQHAVDAAWPVVRAVVA